MELPATISGEGTAEQVMRLVDNNLGKLRSAVRGFVKTEFEKRNLNYTEEMRRELLLHKPFGQMSYEELHKLRREVERDPDDAHAVVNPTVIIEVLSDTTAESDRGDKFADYRRLRALREYVLVSQRERRIDVYRRDGRRWHLDEFGPGERVVLESIDVTLAVDDVYVDGLGAIVATPRA